MSAEEKKEALKHIVQGSLMKDVNFWFNKDQIGYLETILHIINDQFARIHNKRAVKNIHNISSSVIEKYTRFLEDHFLITTLHHFFSDKKKEVSHKRSSVFLDLGVKNYLDETFTVSLNDPKIMRYVVLQEIYKNI